MTLSSAKIDLKLAVRCSEFTNVEMCRISLHRIVSSSYLAIEMYLKTAIKSYVTVTSIFVYPVTCSICRKSMIMIAIMFNV